MPVIITTSWDDGNKLDLKVAKLLDKYSLKGTFYVPIRWRYRNLSNEDIFRLSKKFEIGSHGLTHKALTILSVHEVMKELLKSKKMLEKITHQNVKSFSYPYGMFNAETIRCVKKAGYKFARTVEEFCIEKPKYPLVAKISLQLSNRFSRLFSLRKLVKIKKFSWYGIAKELFDRAYKHNGVFHIFGHSVEIEKNNEWDILEDLFDYITFRSNFISVSNSELVS
jgi:peptidoglycan/xylan/chitin deacetylase (PgdA/CDA1 family)